MAIPSSAAPPGGPANEGGIHAAHARVAALAGALALATASSALAGGQQADPAAAPIQKLGHISKSGGLQIEVEPIPRPHQQARRLTSRARDVAGSDGRPRGARSPKRPVRRPEPWAAALTDPSRAVRRLGRA